MGGGGGSSGGERGGAGGIGTDEAVAALGDDERQRGGCRASPRPTAGAFSMKWTT